MNDLLRAVPFSPNLPDVMSQSPDRAFSGGEIRAFFSKDVKPIAARAAQRTFISYPYVFTVTHSSVQGPILFVTSEVSILGTTCLGVFDPSGSHMNLGQDDALNSESAFVAKSIDIVRNTFGVSLYELTRAKAPTRKRTWVARLFS